ncbi:MAG: hypothetical protein JWL73_3680 [Actinomycetia bacterium]|nr:hypothetical protein [Actinomycetes bacterium]
MTDEAIPDPDRVHERAEELLTDEIDAGSDDPEAQAYEILAESDERTDDRDVEIDDPENPDIEHRTSEDTVLPE